MNAFCKLCELFVSCIKQYNIHYYITCVVSITILSMVGFSRLCELLSKSQGHAHRYRLLSYLLLLKSTDSDARRYRLIRDKSSTMVLFIITIDRNERWERIDSKGRG